MVDADAAIVDSFEGRKNWLLADICKENNFDDPELLAAELGDVLSLPPSLRIDILSECWMSYPTRAF